MSPYYYSCQVFTITLHRLWNEVQTPDPDILATKNVNPSSHHKPVPVTVPQTLHAHFHLYCAFIHSKFPPLSLENKPSHSHTFPPI